MFRAMPVGVVLAGGGGRRMGGEKALVELAGRPLLLWPVEALRAVVEEVVVACKEQTALPPLPDGVAVWREPAEPRHPLAGVAHALRQAGREVLVCAGDLPLVGERELRALLQARAEAPAVVARERGGRIQPLLAAYRLPALAALEAAGDQPATDVVKRLGAVEVEVREDALLNVNTPADLARAEALLASRT